MERATSHLDITQIFADLDDFCQVFEPLLQGMLLPEVTGSSLPKSRMRLSEIMTVLLGFHGSGYRTFKDFYTLQVLEICPAQFSQLHPLCRTDFLGISRPMLLSP